MKIILLALCVLLAATPSLGVDQPLVALAFKGIVSRAAIVDAEPPTPSERAALLRSVFRGVHECPGLDWDAKENAGYWEVTQRTADWLSIHRCDSDNVVELHLYRKSSKGYLAVLAYVTGNHGQSVELSFYALDEQLRFVRMVTARQIGLREPHVNELLDKHDWFPQKENYSTSLSLGESGVIHAEVWTWNDPRWFQRKMARKIQFRWGGKRFIEEVVQADKE